MSDFPCPEGCRWKIDTQSYYTYGLLDMVRGPSVTGVYVALIAPGGEVIGCEFSASVRKNAEPAIVRIQRKLWRAYFSWVRQSLEVPIEQTSLDGCAGGEDVPSPDIPADPFDIPGW